MVVLSSTLKKCQCSSSFRFCYCPTDRCNTAPPSCSLAPLLLLLPLIITISSSSSFSFFPTKTTALKNISFDIFSVIRACFVQSIHLMRYILTHLKILICSFLEHLRHFLPLPVFSVWLMVGSKAWQPHRTLS